MLTGLGVLAGTLAWLLIMQWADLFKLPEGAFPTGDFAEQMAFMLDPEKSGVLRAQLDQVKYRNTLLTFAIIGTALASVLGLGEGFARKSFRATAIGATAGIVVGAVLGALAGLAVQFTERQLQPFAGIDLTFMIFAVHATAWAIIGIAVGMAIALPTFQPRVIGRSMIAAVMAGPVAAFLFLLLGMFLVFFSNASPDNAIPNGALNRLCWTTLAAVMMGLFVGALGKGAAAKT